MQVLYSFRLPHHDCSASMRMLSNSNSNKDVATIRSDPGTGGTDHDDDYNLVLDNYVEYTDDLKIPRLRGKDIDRVRSAFHNGSHWLALSVTVTGSCLLTYSLSNNEPPNLKADIAQALVLTLVLATFPEVAASAGAGAFAGMASARSVPHYGWLCLLALTVSVVWWLFHRFKILVGCGGRLGTCAFLAMNITVALWAMPSGAVPWELYGDTGRLWAERLEVVPSILEVVACTGISAVAGAVRLKSKIPLNPVQAPTTIALLCMLILEPTGFVYTEQVDAGLAVGSFVAMASDQYLPTVLDFGAAGFLAGLWTLFLEPFFLGFGGKKGFTSFCGFATYVALSKGIRLLLGSKKK